MIQTQQVHHIERPDWLRTPNGDPRGYVQPKSLRELWFHTGTACNLACPFCLEGSKPGDKRLGFLTLDEVRPLVSEAITLGTERFSFTGGEPFVNPEMVRILDHALDLRPCLVLTNATAPLKKRLPEILPLKSKPHPLNLRVSLDYPDPARHDAGRGEGNFERSLETMALLHRAGFRVSVARQMSEGEDGKAVNAAYGPHLERAGLPKDLHFTVFPDFLRPGSLPKVPHVTEKCMTAYQTEETRDAFMCGFSKMVVKKDGKVRVYACTLVDDDPDYDLGGTLMEAMPVRVMLKHHRCYSCFAFGASCSE